MLKKLIVILVPLIAFLGGVAAGDLFGESGGTKPAQEHGAAPAESAHAPAERSPDHAAPPAGEHSAADANAAKDAHASPAAGGDHGGGDGHGAGVETTIFKFASQFFVPVVRNGRTDSVMIMTVTLDTAPGTLSKVAAQENRLRDSLLRSLIIHANTGGFDGNFTAETSLGRLRESLLKASREIAGADVTAVLIEDIARKES